MPEPKILTPVAPLVLAGEQYLLARNGGYSLHRPLPPDAFNVVAHVPIESFEIKPEESDALLQHLGALIEENERLKKAVGKGAG